MHGVPAALPQFGEPQVSKFLDLRPSRISHTPAALPQCGELQVCNFLDPRPSRISHTPSPESNEKQNLQTTCVSGSFYTKARGNIMHAFFEI